MSYKIFMVTVATIFTVLAALFAAPFAFDRMGWQFPGVPPLPPPPLPPLPPPPSPPSPPPPSPAKVHGFLLKTACQKWWSLLNFGLTLESSVASSRSLVLAPLSKPRIGQPSRVKPRQALQPSNYNSLNCKNFALFSGVKKLSISSFAFFLWAEGVDSTPPAQIPSLSI